MKYLLLLINLVFSISASALAHIPVCPHLKNGTPKASDVVLCREGYALGYNNKLKSAEWVSYILEKEPGNDVDRQDDFRVDPDIKSEFQTTPDDYDEPIYHQGHLANSESIDQTQSANDETFFMSNMTPQLPTHNTGIWKGLENRERKWANKRGRVIVLAGPVYHNEFSYIGKKVPVPSAYWKVIYDPQKKEAIAYLIPHKKLKTKQLDNYLVSIDHIEEMYELDLLNMLDDKLEDAIEKITQPKQW
ncbi:DNA/RNA non-specific endonuclease [Colwellia demingiae]|uniref:DNA/RNA non-specific endonuclease n=1 Tax=Colwellia demingiae TaxID=89401 RepID=A0A5C6QA51_9GAMM|nr:DNA/RNA non-specific endonuclease [Colwellia demingiae]TWX65532.1 DNA/RNA non-specific endonuclease [Colwellia demingiae]